MYQSETSLPAILPASDYTTDEANARDMTVLRNRSWQLVATESMLARPGDFVACERFGIPFLIRNHEGELIAVSNICAHRNCRLVENGCGHAEAIKCPYHGWQYGADGRTRKLPGAKNFPGFDREQYRLEKYAVQKLGPLVFVHLGNPEHSPLEQFEPWRSLFEDRTDPEQWRFNFHDRIEYPCDWKIVIEGSLESYHLSEVHSETFAVDPAEQDIEHLMGDTGTMFQTRVREQSSLAKWEERLIRYLSGSFDPLYRHVHLFPGVMASMTETISLIYQIFPTSTGCCAMELFGYSRQSKKADLGRRFVSHVIGQGARDLSRKVLAEDAAIFPKVQQGMEAAVASGLSSTRIFGRCEERLHAFHQYWAAHKETNDDA